MLLPEVPFGNNSHRGVVVKLQLPENHYPSAVLQASKHHRQTFMAFVDLNETAPNDPLRLALVILRHLVLLVLLLPDDVDRVAVGDEGDHRLRHHDTLPLTRQHHLEVGKHIRQQLIVRAFQGGADLQVAGPVVNLRVGGGGPGVEHPARVGGDPGPHQLAAAEWGEVLSGQVKVRE